MKAFNRGILVLGTALLVACVAHEQGRQESDTSHTAVRAQPPAAGGPEAVEVAGQLIPSTPEAAAVPVDVVSAENLAQLVKSLSNDSNDKAIHNRTAQAPKRELKDGYAANICCQQPLYSQPTNTEQYEHREQNPVHLAAEQPVSTFSIDVDTGSYANVRRLLNGGQLPPMDAVRVEEMINYFDYGYTPPTSRATPFAVATELAPAPWNKDALLLKIGIKGFEIKAAERPAANLVFLIDVSGSMNSPDKLPLLKNAFRLLTAELTAKDRVSMVVYAGSSGVVLEPTAGDQKHKVLEALDRLQAGGSTNGAEGIERAYHLARQAYLAHGINRVVLATDGDFNVGTVNFEALLDMAKRQRASGVALTTLGFGTGNYNDKLMEQLADAGNGNYAYVDTLNEARKVLGTELSATLFTIAKDVKIQVEFNPAQVREYRLIGYENRILAREDFNNDKVDAGDIGAGHKVTALYEIIPANKLGRVDPLRYGGIKSGYGVTLAELANIKLRYKQPDAQDSKLLEFPIKADAVRQDPSADFKLAASVAAFGQLLKGGKHLGDYSYQDAVALGRQALGEDRDGYRRELLGLIKLADALTPHREQVSMVKDGD
jgi:Ca-activated chloride channel homolog